MNGKGDKKRPVLVPQEQVNNNWKIIFEKKTKKKRNRQKIQK